MADIIHAWLKGYTFQYFTHVVKMSKLYTGG